MDVNFWDCFRREKTAFDDQRNRVWLCYCVMTLYSKSLYQLLNSSQERVHWDLNFIAYKIVKVRIIAQILCCEIVYKSLYQLLNSSQERLHWELNHYCLQIGKVRINA